MQPPIEEPCPWNGPCHGHRGAHGMPIGRALPMEWPIRNPKAKPWHGHGVGGGGGTNAATIEEPCPWNGPCHGHEGSTHGMPIEELCPWNGQSGSPRQCHGIYHWGRRGVGCAQCSHL